MEIVKVRLQTQKDGAPKKELWTIVKELGVKGLYDGAGVTLARDVPSSAIFFAIYTLLRGLYPDQSFLAGAIAAIPATILVTPMDIIKTRLQVHPIPQTPAPVLPLNIHLNVYKYAYNLLCSLIFSSISILEINLFILYVRSRGKELFFELQFLRARMQ